MHKEYALPFAAWDLRLYLDTHPYDKCALELYRKLCSQIDCKCNYACVPSEHYSGEHHSKECWGWISDPWPWEAEANRPIQARRETENYCRQECKTPDNRFRRSY